MKPASGELKKFRKQTKYQHNRSEGLTHRTNGGTCLPTTRKNKSSNCEGSGVTAGLPAGIPLEPLVGRF